MENINELASALSIAQGKMEGAAKDTANPFFKSKYADLASVTGAVRTGLSGTGLSYVQVIHDTEHAAGIETIILHSSGQSLSTGIVRVPVAKADAQGFGSALTYARRYSLAAAFGVAPEDDDGNAATKAKPVVKTLESGREPKVQTVTGEAFNALDADTKDMLTRYANEVKKGFDSGVDAAFEIYEKHKSRMDGDTQVAFWRLFDSKQRSSIKDASVAAKELAEITNPNQ